MSYVDKILQPGEVVLGQTRIHWFIYLQPLLTILLGFAILAASIAVPLQYELYTEIGGALLIVIGLWGLFLAWIRRLSTELAVTNRRVIHKTGFFGRSTQEINRDKVESVDVQQSFAGRIFGYGTVSVRGIGSTWEPFANIADPLTFRNHITAA